MTARRKKPSRQHKGATFGKVSRGDRGDIQMIEFSEYATNPNAPSILVNKLVGIYRLQPALIKCTFGLESLTAAGVLRTVEAASLIWTDSTTWLDNSDLFKWATAEVRKGTFQNAIPDDGGGRRARTQ